VERRRELQAGDAAKREERTEEVWRTIGDGGGQSSGMFCRSNEQQSL
jgi:hypothetical protein